MFEALGGRVGMLICNDRRWPEAHRVMGLQDVELVCSATTRRSTTPATSRSTC
ncbi:MAG: nitrilase-related carbon-nitrogen hydrolase [Geminicoccaceae bacterium]